MSSLLEPPLSGGPKLGRTWDDVQGPSRETVWRHLRSLRHQPPRLAVRGARRDTFTAALQQSEDLFRSAATVDFSSRPILLFYALSQAGRAVAAVASSATTQNQWKLDGHGITVTNLSNEPSLVRLEVKDKGAGSFTQLASLLRSGSIPNGAPIGQVWSTIPSLSDTPIGDSTDRLPALGYQRTLTPLGMAYGRLTGVPGHLSEASNIEMAVAEFLARYPSLSGNEFPRAATTPYEVDRANNTLNVTRSWERPQGVDPDAFDQQLTQPYLGDNDRWIFPALGDAESPLHPLLAWWALLFPLSMLARYEPARWATHIDVDSSPNAVPIETALTKALTVCPELILFTIRAVSN